MITEIIFVILLGIVTILDMKYRLIPSVFLTGLCIVSLALNYQNIVFGLLGLLLMLLFWEFNEKKIGIADFKVIFIITLFISSLQAFISFSALLSIGQLVYVVLMKKYTNIQEMPFIPVLYAVFIGMLVGGMI